MISSYVTYCVDGLIPAEQITLFPNIKARVTTDLKDVLNKKKRVFFQGWDEKKQVNKEVKLAAKKAKNLYRTKIKSRFKGSSLRDA